MDFHYELPSPRTRKKKRISKKKKKKLQKEANHSLDLWTAKQKWKKRKLDLREEEDVGQAMEHGLQKAPAVAVARFPRRKNKPKKYPKVEAEEEEVVEEQEEVPEVLDTSEEENEESQVLSQLLKGSQEVREKLTPKKLAKDQDSDDDDDIVGHPDLATHWQRGELQVDDTDLVRYRQGVMLNKTNYKRVKKPARLTPKMMLLHQQSDPILTLAAMPKAETLLQSEREASPVWPLPQNRISSLQSASYLHCRQWQRLASRMIFQKHINVRFSLRVLRLIWNHVRASWFTHRADTEAQQSRIVESVMVLQGRHFCLYSTHRWKHRRRRTVARLLGLTDHRLSERFHGTSSFPKALRDRLLAYDCERVVEDHAVYPTTSTAWAPGPNNAMPEAQTYVNWMTTTEYQALPNTQPPVPIMPMDASCMVAFLGPTDRYASYLHTLGQIDGRTYRLAVANLLQLPSDFRQEQLQQMTLEAIELNTRTKALRYYRFLKSITSELQQPWLHISYLGYWSMVIPQLLEQKQTQSSESVDSSDDSTQDLSMGCVPKYNEDNDSTSSVAPNMGPTTFTEAYDQLETIVDSPGVNDCEQLRLLFGLLRMAKVLPHSAVEILAQPTIETTPFVVLQAVLLHLEDNYHLISERRASLATVPERTLKVGELDYAFYQASETFGKCIDINPFQLKFYCWRAAALASCMILCSGNKIGSGACPYPSKANQQQQQESNLFLHIDAPDDDEDTIHIRKMLPKFHSLRRETAQAVKALFEFAEKQGDLAFGCHDAISSLLEWSQVMALLLGPESDDNSIAAVGELHKQTRHNPLQASDDASEKLEILAAVVEQDPGNKNSWKRLVEELGPVGRPHEDCIDQHDCSIKTQCNACSLLVNHYYIDHVRERERLNNGRWWGKNRHDWWKLVLFDLTDVGSLLPPRSDYKKLQEMLSEILLEFPVHSPVPKPWEGITAARQPRSKVQLGKTILKEALCANNTDIVSITTSQHQECMDDRLPRHSTQYMNDDATISSTTEVDNDDKYPWPEQSELSQEELDVVQISCYQIIVAAHLYSPEEEWVRSRVLDYARPCWSFPKQCIITSGANIQAVKWLHQMGISGSEAIRMAKRNELRLYQTRKKKK